MWKQAAALLVIMSTMILNGLETIRLRKEKSDLIIEKVLLEHRCIKLLHPKLLHLFLLFSSSAIQSTNICRDMGDHR